VRCDGCGATEGEDSRELMHWITVTWGYGRWRGEEAEYCSASCATEGLAAHLAAAAEELLADDDPDGA
jgi:hypothetical protein